ncbi:DUF523 domain-containing protein [Candidatus Roizmanbacteria bacterium]|jgi:uncharacterized protein YbbK (DUF523 family)|nr:DUF523 domain-containing protein [Candidatus Roizmanbacteria bacterium]
MKIVSACLVGINCRYDGKSKPCREIIKMVRSGKAIPVCPEILGGLPIPRSPAEIKDGKVMTKDGKDVTEQYLKGANEVLKLAELVGAKKAILKARSPSCGNNRIYDGTFSMRLVKGDGILTRLLKQKGIKVITEEEI